MIRKKKVTLYDRIRSIDCRELLRENKLSVSLVAVILLQSPFTILYFAAGSETAVPKQPIARKQPPAETPKPSGPPQLPESRPDPFALLPGMEKPPEQIAAGLSSEPQIFDAFRAGPPPAGPDQVRPAPVIGIQPLPAPVPSIAPSAQSASSAAVSLRGLKLNGVVRYHGQSVAVFQLPDKSTVHTGEGERVAGTDCYVESILANKVCIKWREGAESEKDWLFVGEEWRT